MPWYFTFCLLQTFWVSSEVSVICVYCSAEDRREYLEALLRECKKEEAAPVLDDDALNDVLARRFFLKLFYYLSIIHSLVYVLIFCWLIGLLDFVYLMCQFENVNLVSAVGINGNSGKICIWLFTTFILMNYRKWFLMYYCHFSILPPSYHLVLNLLIVDKIF